MTRTLIFAAALAALATPAMAAGSMTVNALIKECSRGSDYCYGYVLGVADSQKPCGLAQAANKGTITGRQLRAVVEGYLYRNPQKWHLSGHVLVLEAFVEAWPCLEQVNS